MAAKLYVGNLAYTVTEDRLQEHFAQHGSVVSARIITDKFTGQSKGFGFVEMSSDQEAEKAISALNGTDFEGRNIVVSEARPQAPRAPRRAAAAVSVATAADATVTSLPTWFPTRPKPASSPIRSREYSQQAQSQPS